MSLTGSAGSAARVVGLLSTEGFRLARDRMARGDDVPSSVDELDAAVLEDLIGTPVRSVERIDVARGTTDRARLALDGPSVPATVFAKLAPVDRRVRFFGNLARLGATEVGFYRDVRPVADVAAPAVLGQRFDPRTGRYVLVLEDLEARGAEFRDVEDCFDVAEARAALTTLAGLHASLAAGSAGDLNRRWPWLTTLSGDRLTPVMTPVLRRLVRRVGRRDPDLVPDGVPAMVADYGSVTRVLDDGAVTVLHGDPHPGNWFLDGDGAGLLDWQAARIGNPLRDVAYFLVLSLTTDDRRHAERDLLAWYGDAVAERGGPALDLDATWRTYRAMVAYPYVAAMFTAGFGGMQDEQLAFDGLRRAAAAVRDLDAVAAVRSSSRTSVGSSRSRSSRRRRRRGSG